ncbi:MAG: VIT1/CCC1 transporter family protein, partial [Gammaproteobacteria bacterium]
MNGALDNWYEERQSAWLYRVIALRETDQKTVTLFTDLAQAADGQAKIWAASLKDAPPTFAPSMRA